MTASREFSTSYRAADGSELPMLVFEPAEGTPPVAGIVMFHGGALHSGSADGLAPRWRQLAPRGIFAVSAGYRLIGQGAMSIDDCIADVRRAAEHFLRLAAVRGARFVTPIGQVRRFRDAMVQAGNDCILLEYERAEHAFHYPGPAGHFDHVVDATAEFLLDRLAAD